MVNFTRKNHRLLRDTYTDYHAYSVTIRTDNSQKFFTDPELVQTCIHFLRLTTDKFAWEIHAYCFMPDHLHILLSPTREPADLIAFISDFKQHSGYWFKQQTKIPLWQKNFFDHILRRDEQIHVVTKYIFENPQKDGLVENWRDYPFVGSFVYNLDDVKRMEG